MEKMSSKNLKIENQRIRQERDILRKEINRFSLKPSAAFGFIDEHRRRWNTKAMCRALGVSRSGFYQWKKHTPSQREIDHQKLLIDIKKIYADSNGRYGSRRITDKLHAKGWSVSRNWVASIMRKAGLRSVAR
jgi:putative transposase